MKFQKQRPDSDEAMIVDCGRIWGGIAWPGDRPGYCCIVGEQKLPECLPDKTYYPLYLLAERQATGNNKVELVETAIDMGRQFKINRWYGRGFNDSDNALFLRQWNKTSRDRNDPIFKIRTATNTETPSLSYQLGALATALQDNELILHWTLGSIFQTELISTPQEIDKVTALAFPAIAAMGYVSSQFLNFPPKHHKPRLTTLTQRSASGY